MKSKIYQKGMALICGAALLAMPHRALAVGETVFSIDQYVFIVKIVLTARDTLSNLKDLVDNAVDQNIGLGSNGFCSKNNVADLMNSAKDSAELLKANALSVPLKNAGSLSEAELVNVQAARDKIDQNLIVKDGADYTAAQIIAIRQNQHELANQLSVNSLSTALGNEALSQSFPERSEKVQELIKNASSWRDKFQALAAADRGILAEETRFVSLLTSEMQLRAGFALQKDLDLNLEGGE